MCTYNSINAQKCTHLLCYMLTSFLIWSQIPHTKSSYYHESNLESELSARVQWIEVERGVSETKLNIYIVHIIRAHAQTNEYKQRLLCYAIVYLFMRHVCVWFFFAIGERRLLHDYIVETHWNWLRWVIPALVYVHDGNICLESKFLAIQSRQSQLGAVERDIVLLSVRSHIDSSLKQVFKCKFICLQKYTNKIGISLEIRQNPN